MIMRRTALLTVPNGGFLLSRHSRRKLRHTCKHKSRKGIHMATIRHPSEPFLCNTHTHTYLTQDQRNHHSHEELSEDGRERNGGRRAELEEWRQQDISPIKIKSSFTHLESEVLQLCALDCSQAAMLTHEPPLGLQLPLCSPVKCAVCKNLDSQNLKFPL